MSLPKYKNAQISSISGSKEILVFLDVHLNQSTVTKEKGSFKTGDLLKTASLKLEVFQTFAMKFSKPGNPTTSSTVEHKHKQRNRKTTQAAMKIC
jgi:hypothetical protein